MVGLSLSLDSMNYWSQLMRQLTLKLGGSMKSIDMGVAFQIWDRAYRRTFRSHMKNMGSELSRISEIGNMHNFFIYSIHQEICLSTFDKIRS